MPVGNAIIFETEDNSIPYLISAPTMRVPSDVSNTVNSYLVFKAIIQSVLLFNRTADTPIATVPCPGLGTGEGKLAAEDCARQMRAAFEVYFGGKMISSGGLAGAVDQHIELMGLNS